MLDFSAETTLSLAAAAKVIPPGRNGKCTHLSTILRWIISGVKNPSGMRIRLEAVRMGSRWVTSWEALRRFSDRLTPKFEDAPPAQVPRSPAARQKADDWAAQKLDTMGI